MTDENFIINFLEKNYKIGFKDNAFIIIELNSKIIKSLEKFVKEFKIIIGDFQISNTNSIDVFNNWVVKKKVY